MRILGLDVGDKRIGVAVCDALMIAAHGVCVYQRKDEARDLDYFKALAKEREIERLVIGLPKNMDGSIGFQAQATQAFGDALEKHCGIPVVYWDERLTSAFALQTLRDTGASRKQRKQAVDKVAAVHILQSYLDSLGNEGDR